jgi:ABC-type lipoprotein release transport system permease subunit
MNSFLMVIFERIRELGILLAGGVRPRMIRRMLVREAIFIALLGGVAGIALAAGLLGYWLVRGLDLSAFAEGLGSFGVDSVIYPVLDPVHLGTGFVIILVMVMLAVQYPAWKAGRFEAVEAINHD